MQFVALLCSADPGLHVAWKKRHYQHQQLHVHAHLDQPHAQSHPVVDAYASESLMARRKCHRHLGLRMRNPEDGKIPGCQADAPQQSRPHTHRQEAEAAQFWLDWGEALQAWLCS